MIAGLGSADSTLLTESDAIEETNRDCRDCPSRPNERHCCGLQFMRQIVCAYAFQRTEICEPIIQRQRSAPVRSCDSWRSFRTLGDAARSPSASPAVVLRRINTRNASIFTDGRCLPRCRPEASSTRSVRTAASTPAATRCSTKFIISPSGNCLSE